MEAQRPRAWNSSLPWLRCVYTQGDGSIFRNRSSSPIADVHQSSHHSGYDRSSEALLHADHSAARFRCLFLGSARQAIPVCAAEPTACHGAREAAFTNRATFSSGRRSDAAGAQKRSSSLDRAVRRSPEPAVCGRNRCSRSASEIHSAEESAVAPRNAAAPAPACGACIRVCSLGKPPDPANTPFLKCKESCARLLNEPGCGAHSVCISDPSPLRCVWACRSVFRDSWFPAAAGRPPPTRPPSLPRRLSPLCSAEPFHTP